MGYQVSEISSEMLRLLLFQAIYDGGWGQERGRIYPEASICYWPHLLAPSPLAVTRKLDHKSTAVIAKAWPEWVRLGHTLPRANPREGLSEKGELWCRR